MNRLMERHASSYPYSHMTLPSQSADMSTSLGSLSEPVIPSPNLGLKGKRVGMVLFSSYPSDPRPRRAAEALLDEGMKVDLICLADKDAPKRETFSELDLFRIPIVHSRGGKCSYLYKYSAFLLASSFILAVRAFKRRYDLVYVHNMPDILVTTALIPKARGAKVILDMHDPMPELMTTIFGCRTDSLGVRLLKRIEKWSMARADLVITPNLACRRIFGRRSCREEKIGIVMNSPDEKIFALRMPCSQRRQGASAKRFVIMYHGSIVERNGLNLAVDALAQVRRTIPNVELRVYGRQTRFLEQVLREARQKGQEEYVRYLGQKSLEELVVEIDNCDLGIIPNQRNAFTDINIPTRIFEYLAIGKPVIAPRTGGIQDYFGPDSLLFFEAGSADDLARQIEYVFFHPREVLNIVERGQNVFTGHRWPQEKQMLLNLVSRLVS